MILDSILVDGIAGFVQCASERRFKLDYSSFIELVQASYRSAVTYDRGLKKHMSCSMYQYYCVVLLWKRLYYVISRRGPLSLEYQRLENCLNFSMPIPTDIAVYLNGIGEIVDQAGRQFYLQLHSELTDQVVRGLTGSFGRYNANSHLSYETMPAPFVSVWRMVADIRRTQLPQAEGPVVWNLPEPLACEQAGTVPNQNLLGWRRAERLTDDQVAALEQAGINTGRPEEPPLSFVDVGGIPVNQSHLAYIAGAINNSKCRAVSLFNESVRGSLSQSVFSTRVTTDVETNGESISAKAAITNSYTQTTTHIACAAAICRYRIKRREALETDMVGYTFEGPIPAIYLADQNAVFDFGAGNRLWNQPEFRVSEQNGLGLL